MFHLSQFRRVNNWKRMTDIFQRGYSKQAASESLEAGADQNSSANCLLVGTYGRNHSVCSALCKPVLGQQW